MHLEVLFGDNGSPPIIISDEAQIYELLERVLPIKPVGPAPSEASYRIVALRDDRVSFISPNRPRPLTLDRSMVAETLVAELTHIRLFLGAGDHLHASAVAHNDEGLVFVGASGAGKSTMAARLVRDGWCLLNDEQVRVDSQRRKVVGFPRPIAITPEGREVVSSLGVVDSPPPPALRTWLVRPESLGSRWTSEAITTAIYDLQRRPGPVQVGVVPPEIAFEILCQNSLDLMANIPAGLGALSWLAASVPLARLRYDEGEDAVRTLNLNLATISNWHAVEAQVEQPRLAEEDPAPIGRGNPSDHVYSVTMGDRVVLFDPRSRVVARLDRKGSMIWNRTAHPRRRVRGRRQLSEQLRAIGIAS